MVFKKWTEARSWLIMLSLLCSAFIFLTISSVVRGVSGDELNVASQELKTLKKQTSPVTDEEIMKLRTSRIEQSDALIADLKTSVSKLMDGDGADAFGETYGQKMKVVLESELKGHEFTNVDIQHQPLLYVDDSYPLSFVFDDSLHIFAYVDFETNTIVPQYVSRESEGE